MIRGENRLSNREAGFSLEGGPPLLRNQENPAGDGLRRQIFHEKKRVYSSSRIVYYL